MRKLAIAAVALMLAGGVVSAANPILTGEAEAKVRVTVVANIAVGVLTPQVDVGQIAFGEFTAKVTFRIDANVEEVKIKIIATDLYKGDSASSPWKIPVKTGTDTGALVEPQMGNAMGGHSNLLLWVALDALHGMVAHVSEEVAFESGQNAHFSQPVDVTITYDQNYAELPKGEYSGFVKLVATIDP